MKQSNAFSFSPDFWNVNPKLFCASAISESISITFSKQIFAFSICPVFLNIKPKLLCALKKLESLLNIL